MQHVTPSTLGIAAAGLSLLLLAGTGPSRAGDKPFENTSAEKGAKIITKAGCGACHIIPGIGTANGLVGPPLIHFSRRIFIAGLLRNTPDNLVTWLRNPQKIVPGNAMPDMGLSKAEAQAITDYLYTLE